jgi:hypothetical protein
MTLYLPPSIAAEKRREFAAQINARVHVDRRCVEWTQRLQTEVDPLMVMVRANDTIEIGTPLWPGHYHVLRFNPQAPMSVIPVHEEGRYCEPDSRLLEVLNRGRLTEHRVTDRLAADERAEQRRLDRVAANAKEERRTELVERVDAATRTQVTTDRSQPWTQNVSGRRPR